MFPHRLTQAAHTRCALQDEARAKAGLTSLSVFLDTVLTLHAARARLHKAPAASDPGDPQPDAAADAGTSGADGAQGQPGGSAPEQVPQGPQPVLDSVVGAPSEGDPTQPQQQPLQPQGEGAQVWVCAQGQG